MENRNNKEYQIWKSKVNVRDNFTCQDCGKTNVNAAHHIISWVDNPKLRYEVNNGKTLCVDCHLKYAHRGKKKTKDGKIISIYLSKRVIELLKDFSFKGRISSSQFIEELIIKESLR